MRKDICKQCEFNEFVRCGVNFCVLPRCKKNLPSVHRGQKSPTEKAKCQTDANKTPT